METDFDSIFKKLILREAVVLAIDTRKEFDTLRVSLLRRYRKYAELAEYIGAPDPFEDEFLKCEWDKKTKFAKFKISPVELRNATHKKVYRVVEL